MSLIDYAKKIDRVDPKVKISIAGIYGCGKTRTALELASAIVGGPVAERGDKILFIETEAPSAEAFIDEVGFRWTHIDWVDAKGGPDGFGAKVSKGKFQVRTLAKVIEEAGEAFDLIIIDSSTEFWQGPGGRNDVGHSGSGFKGWNQAKDDQTALYRAIKDAPAHIIITIRAKPIETAVKGKSEGPVDMQRTAGKLEQDESFLYRMTMHIDMDVNHEAKISKSRITHLDQKKVPKGVEGVNRVGVAIAEWIDTPLAIAATEEMNEELEAAIIEDANKLIADAKSGSEDLASSSGEPVSVVEETVEAAATEEGAVHDPVQELISSDQVSELMFVFESAADAATATEAKKSFAAKFGKPAELACVDFGDALKLANSLVA